MPESTTSATASSSSARSARPSRARSRNGISLGTLEGGRRQQGRERAPALGGPAPDPEVEAVVERVQPERLAPAVRERAVAVEERRGAASARSSRVAVGAREVEERIGADRVREVDEPADAPAGAPARDQDVLLVAVVVAERRTDAPREQLLARGDGALDPPADRGVAAEPCVLAQALLEALAHVREVCRVRPAHAEPPDVPERLRRRLVELAQEAAELAVDARPLPLVEAVEDVEERPPRKPRHEDVPVLNGGSRGVGGEDPRQHPLDRAGERVVDAHLLLHL